MAYVDGFVTPVPKKNLAAYKRLSKKCCQVWMEYGALSYDECLGDELAIPGVGSFVTALGLKKGETVAFAFIRYKTKKHRDQVNAKAMKDPRVQMPPGRLPFDCTRLLYGGFRGMVSSGT
ncbi:MAG: DUF1428 domain-containing protein [Armatimonadetes bacterium]|nr:DUF1428 domain-containing protein [Armatimonadota bacterium]